MSDFSTAIAEDMNRKQREFIAAHHAQLCRALFEYQAEHVTNSGVRIIAHMLPDRRTSPRQNIIPISLPDDVDPYVLRDHLFMLEDHDWM